MIRIRARWLFPGNGAPLSNVILAVDEGKIVSVGSASQTDELAEIDLGPVALIPGLINAHTHLEFSDLEAPVEPRERFADWIEAVIHRRRQQQSDPLVSIQKGLDECRKSGTLALAEIATSDWILRLSPADQRPRVFTFREILGLSPERVSDQLQTAESFLKQARSQGLSNIGLSPHAPYSLHPDLFRGLIDLAVRDNVPVAMHLAESPAEIELLRSGTGPLVDLFQRMGIWQSGVLPTGTRPLDFLRELARAPRGLVVHGNLLDEEELRFLAATPQLSVVYCPRTHRAMQQTPSPWRRLLNLGINLTLGTDSRASNPDLSIWNELRHLHSQAADLPASSLLKLATSNAAEALGWKDLGRLAPGFAADFCVVPLSETGLSAPESKLFEHTPCRFPAPADFPE